MNSSILGIRSTNQLIDCIDSGQRPKYVFFWGHRENAAVDKSCFSQWYQAAFEIDGIRYATAEHYMMASKARLFNDLATLEKILSSTKPEVAKKLGREVNGYDEAIWLHHRFEIVVSANLAKFSQHPSLSSFLLGTHNRILVEASPVDKIWGIGLAQDHPDAVNPRAWQGLNLLGFALMEVREQLVSST